MPPVILATAISFEEGDMPEEGLGLVALAEPIHIESGIAIAVDAGPIARNFMSAAMAFADRA